MHLSGGMTGLLLAVLYRRWDRVPLVRYDWEDDESVPEWYPEAPAKDDRNPPREP
jgi:hypothetical protein